MKFTKPQYSVEETQKARRSLMATSFVMMFSLFILAYLGIEVTELTWPFYLAGGGILAMYIIGNYKFYIVEPILSE